MGGDRHLTPLISSTEVEQDIQRGGPGGHFGLQWAVLGFSFIHNFIERQ